MSDGTYSQNFDSLADSGAGNPWMENSTLPGWYAAKGGDNATIYIAGDGSGITGGVYSFGAGGVNAVTDRALGSLGSGSATPIAYGVRFINDTGLTVTNIVISCTGEQWRNANGTGAETNILAFSYQVAAAPLTNADAVDSQSWTGFGALDFASPIVGGSGTALDGNAPANRQVFKDVVLAGVEVQPGQELFLRWRDVNDVGSDAGLAIDDLTVSFQSAGISSNPPAILSQPADVMATAGNNASFSVLASGTGPLRYQWQSNSIPVTGATNSTLTLDNVTTNLTGSIFFVTITNLFGSTNSEIATLTVNSPTSTILSTNGAFTYLTYNVNGNGVADWSTNSAQVQAIGRQLVYLHPDIIAFNEIPYTNTYRMADWVTAYMPGYYLATNSGTDGYIRNAIASRWPIVRSKSWLSNSSLTNFGYDGKFTRDLFEAEIAVPNFPEHLHVFDTHLKATTTSKPQSDADERAAQCRSISNFLANTFLPGANGLHPYILSGDLNESALYPDASRYASGHPVQILVSAPTGLHYTDPVNSITHTDLTESIRSPLDTRFDYILPGTLMFSNLLGSEVFRSDLLTNLSPNLYANDDKVASDHLPVLMTFANPFIQPYNITSLGQTNGGLTVQWQSVPGQSYQVESSTNLTVWAPIATNLMATNYISTLQTNLDDFGHFFRVKRTD